MKNTHVLNGDSLLLKFPSSIPGDRIIFREALVDGPVDFESFEEMIQIRRKYLSSTYPGTMEQPYQPYVSDQLKKIMCCSDTDRVFCWFEEDLFCQVNLWYTLYLLRDHEGDIFLVIPENRIQFGFSGMSQEELENIYRNPKILNSNEKLILRKIWHLFQKNKASEAKALATTVQKELPFLIPAIDAWKESIPKGDYPGRPKAELKAISLELKTNEFKYIFKEFQRRLPIYGFGDLITGRLWEEVKEEDSDN